MIHARPLRFGIAAAAVSALATGYALNGVYVLAVGMLAFLVLPLLLRTPLGKVLPTNEGVRIVTGRNPSQRMDTLVRGVGVLCWMTFAWAVSADSAALGITALFLGHVAALVSLVGLAGLVFAPDRDAHEVVFDRETLTINGPTGNHVVPYRRLRSVDVDGSRVWLATEDNDDVHAIDVSGGPKHAAEVAARIRDAHATAERHAQLDAGAAKELARPSGMSAREWLGRVDALATAGRTLSAYRGRVLEEGALWQLLGDDGAEPDARAAAARVLASSSDEKVRVRVASAATAIPVDAIRLRVELAMRPDAEEAAAQLEALDQEELRRTAGV